MGFKLFCTGLVFTLALVPTLAAFGLQGSNVLVLVGAILMIIGNILQWLDK